MPCWVPKLSRRDRDNVPLVLDDADLKQWWARRSGPDDGRSSDYCNESCSW